MSADLQVYLWIRKFGYHRLSLKYKILRGHVIHLPTFLGVASVNKWFLCRADSRLAPSQWETSLQNNAVCLSLAGRKPGISPAVSPVTFRFPLSTWRHVNCIHMFLMKYVLHESHGAIFPNTLFGTENSKQRITDRLWEESNGDRWFPLTEG